MPDLRSGWNALRSRLSAETPEDKRRLAILLVIIVVGIIIGIVCIPYFTQLLDPDTRATFVAGIRSKGPWGVLILLALQVLQVIVAFIPGEVVQIVAGILYGAWGGWAICTAGTAISTLLVYKLVDKLGMPFVEKMISPKQAQRLEFMKDNRKLDFIMFILFFIPGMPKDVLTYFAPITRMSAGRFLAITLIARTPALVASTYGGSAFTQGNYLSMALVFIICGALGILGIVFKDRIMDFLSDKKQEARERRQERLAARERRQAVTGRTGYLHRLQDGRQGHGDPGTGHGDTGREGRGQDGPADRDDREGRR